MLFSKSKEEKIIKIFKKTVEEKRKNYSSPLQMILDVRSRLTRIELMILDSAIKNMPLENLHKTLLLKQEIYFEILQNVTHVLKTIKNTD